MNPLACTSPTMPSASSRELDHERRFQPTREALDAFLRDTRHWAVPCVYDYGLPHAFTRTTYFDTDGLDFLDSCRAGHARRLRLREYAGTPDLALAARLSGVRYLELKTSLGARRSKVRVALSPQEAEALLTGADLSPRSEAARMLRQLPHAAVKPWVTAWYRRGTHATPDAGVRITVDEDLVFALPPERSTPDEPAAPSRLLAKAPAILLEVKWWGSTPPWLVEPLWRLEPFETRGSKFEQGMRARLARVPSTQ